MTIITTLDPQPTPAGKTGVIDSLKKVTSAIGDLGTSVTEGASELIGSTKVGQKAAVFGGQIADGAKTFGKGIVEAGEKIGSNLTGAETHTKIQELAAQQTRYNDILATRLAEALGRIEVLEQEMKALSRGR
jgi:hypothetical protein